MPLTLRAKTLLKWNSHLGSTCRASPRRRKALGWQLLGYAYSIACLILFDRMVLGSCSSSCSNRLVTTIKREGDKDTHACKLNGLYSTVSELCDCLAQSKSEERRKHLLERHHLEFCDILPFGNHLSVLANDAKCTENLLRILQADCVALHNNSKFEDIIGRIDCKDKYSVRWNCSDCKNAYKGWICSTTVLPLMLEEGKKPCHFGTCKRVLQRCPYFLPNPDNQWSGQSAFECDMRIKDINECIDVSSPLSKNHNSKTLGS